MERTITGVYFISFNNRVLLRCNLGESIMEFQEMIDNEQNKIRNTAKSLSDRELIKFLLIYGMHGLATMTENKFTREELIDKYCEIVFDRNHL